MPLNLAPEDRKTVIGLGVLLAVALLIAAYVVKTDGGSGAVPSSYSAGNDGTKAAFLLLEQTGYAPIRWTESPKKLAEVAPNATLILVEPSVTDERDIKAVQQFVEAGGRVVGTGAGFVPFFPEHRMRPGMPHFQWKEYRPQEPSDLTKGINSIELAPKFYFDPEKSEAPFADGDEVPITRFSYGTGEVIWWSSFEPLSNSAIREKDNAQLLLNCVGKVGRGPVLWDEYFHQSSRTVIDTVLGSPLRWGLLQALLVGVLACFTYSRRFGPVRQSVAVSRLAPMEFVETLATLYQKSGKAHIAVEIVYEHFRGALQRRYSVRMDADASQVAASIVDHLPDKDLAQITLLIGRIENAVGDPSVKATEAKSLIGEMHTLGTQLKLRAGRDE